MLILVYCYDFLGFYRVLWEIYCLLLNICVVFEKIKWICIDLVDIGYLLFFFNEGSVC